MTSATGGSPILSYMLEWDKGNNNWEALQGQEGFYSTALFLLRQTGISPGGTYRFRLTAINLHGPGVTSEVTPILASGAPVAPIPPVTSLNNDLVRITWYPPFNNYESIN